MHVVFDLRGIGVGGDDRRNPLGLHHTDLEAASRFVDLAQRDEQGIAVEDDRGGGVEERVVDARLGQHILVGGGQGLLEGVRGMTAHEVERDGRFHPVRGVDVEVDLRLGVGDDHPGRQIWLVSQAHARVESGGDGEHEAEHALLLPVRHSVREGLVESIGIGEPVRRRGRLPVAGAVDDDGMLDPLGNLERGGIGGIEGHPRTQAGVPAQSHLPVLVEHRAQIGQLVVDEREDVGDLDSVIEEDEVETPQIRRGGRVLRRGCVTAVAGPSRRRHPGPPPARGLGFGGRGPGTLVRGSPAIGNQGGCTGGGDCRGCGGSGSSRVRDARSLDSWELHARRLSVGNWSACGQGTRRRASGTW